MLDILGLATASAAFLMVAAAPGPATLALATISMSAGRRSGVSFGLGLSVGLAVWGVVAATGLGALLQASAQALTVLKLVGGAYLLWLAYGAARSAAREATPAACLATRGNWVRRGLILNLSNPKAVVAWMATLTLGVSEGQSAAQVVAATALCIGIGFAVYAAYALTFSTSGAMRLYASVRRWIDGVVAGLFTIAGLGLIRSALTR